MNIKTAHPSEDNLHGRLKIFVSAYACEPHLGSEIGVGWHWVLEMSKYFELWVLTRESNRHTIEPWIDKHPAYKNIHWLYYDWPQWARFWKKGLRGVRTYYNIWQVCTNHIVKRTMQENDIRIFHHLTYGNALWKVSSYGQKQFFIWGPIGGLETIPEEYCKHYGKKSYIIERIRRQIALLSKWNMGFKNRCKNANLILCKTDFTRQYIPSAYANKTIIFTDVAAEATLSACHKQTGKKDVTEYVTIGRLDAWRGFDLIIEATHAAVKQNDQIHVTIVGEGYDKERLERMVKDRGLGKYISLTGKISMEKYKTLMADADVVINAALKEGAVTVSFDAMALGKPLICIDTTGYTRYFTHDYAIIIPRKGRDFVIDHITKGMLRLTDVETRKMMGKKAQDASATCCWEHHGAEIKDVITRAYRS